MALQKTESSELVPYQNAGFKQGQKRKKVLDEETYTKNIEHIIERDFFPDLPKLQTQAEYYSALERNDHAKLRQLQMKLGPQRIGTGQTSIINSPSTFETPAPHEIQSSPSERNDDKEDETNIPEENLAQEDTDDKIKKVGLDAYLSHNTSEDNASFTEILEQAERKHQEKHAWLYQKVQAQELEHVRKLALPSIEEQAALPSTQPAPDTWTYKPQNYVMYVPDGVELSSAEIIELQKHKPRQICHENTRFLANPFNSNQQVQMVQQAATVKALANTGKIGPDGREIVPTASPTVDGYGFVTTPSPAPGVSESPLMTWGEIENTPFRLDGNTTPGPVFRIPELPKREQLAIKLVENASRAHRTKKQETLRQVTRNFSSPSPKFHRSTSDRLSTMSPAAQLLVSKRLGIKARGDRALRASYTPSPSRSVTGDKTPLLETPSFVPPWMKEHSVTLSGSPASLVPSTPDTPELVTRTPKSDTPKPSSISLTDNLLQLPRRSKASDFF